MDAGTESFLAFVRADDLPAIERLLGQHRDSCLRRAQRIVGNLADADDAVQDAFLRLMRESRAYDGSVPFMAWLGRLVLEASIDLRRASTRRRQRERPAIAREPATTARGEDRAAELRALVAELPDELKAPIEMHYFTGLSQREAAARLGVSENVVAVRIHRGKQRLRRRLAQVGIALALGALEARLSAAASGDAGGGGGRSRAGAGKRTLAIGSVAAALLVATLSALAWSCLRGAGPQPAAVPPAPAAEMEAAAITPQAYAWNFDDGAPGDLQVVSGAWHHLDHGGIGGSGCMETDSGELLVRVDRPVPEGALRMTIEECPRLPATTYQVAMTWSEVEYLRGIYGLGRPAIALAIDPRRDNESYFHVLDYLTADALDMWAGSGRYMLVLTKRRERSPLVLYIRGHLRLDDLRIGRIADGVAPDVSAIRRAVDAVPPAERHGRTTLAGVSGYQGQPVQVDWTATGRVTPAAAP